MRRKFASALAAYAGLAALAAWILEEPRLRASVLVLLAALAVKTWIAELQYRLASRDRLPGGPE
jgi:hypothetical protein